MFVCFNRLMDNHFRTANMREDVERDYEKIHHSAKKFMDDRKLGIRENLEADLIEQKKPFEHEYLNMELCMYSNNSHK